MAAGPAPASHCGSGSRCSGALRGCSNSAFRCEEISTPTLQTTLFWSLIGLGSRWSRPWAPGRGKVQRKGQCRA